MPCAWVEYVALRCRLKEKGRSFRESFLAKLGLLLRGTVAAPPERFGETLADEHIRGGECCIYKQCTTSQCYMFTGRDGAV